jgi:hypothetical protein
MRPVFENDEQLREVPPGYRNVSDKFKRDGEMTARAAELAAVIIEDPQYLDKLLIKAREGTLAPAIERMLWEYRFGRPMEMSKMKTKDVSASDLSEMSLEDLTAMAQRNAEDAAALLSARAAKMGVQVIPGGKPS